MAKFAFILFGVFLLITTAYSLTCYDCNSSKDEVCEKTATCGKSADPNKQSACLKRIYKDGGVMKVIRGCTLISNPNSDKSVDCKPEDEVCSTCKEDKCNSATSITKFSIYTVLGVFISLLFI